MVASPLEMRARRMGYLDLQCIDDIKRQLNKFRFDPAYRGNGQRVPLRQLADLCGVSRQTLYDLVRGDRKGIEPHTRERILAAIALVTERGLRWKRTVIRKPVVERRLIAPGLIEWMPMMPDGSAVPLILRRQRTPGQARHDHPKL
jgi:hypothetical protein